MGSTKEIKQKKLLIVEDDVILSKNLGTFFQDAGFIVWQAADGESGLKTALKEMPDVILLDILLPIMDGLTMLKKLREEHPSLKMPVILLTNLEPDEQILKAIVNYKPIYYYIKKDLRLEDVMTAVQNSLKYALINTK